MKWLASDLKYQKEIRRLRRYLKKYIMREIESQKPLYPRPPLHGYWESELSIKTRQNRYKKEVLKIDKEWKIEKAALIKHYKNLKLL